MQEELTPLLQTNEDSRRVSKELRLNQTLGFVIEAAIHLVDLAVSQQDHLQTQNSLCFFRSAP